MPFGLNSCGPSQGYSMSKPATLSPTTLRVPQSTSRPATPVAGQSFGSPFTPGFPTAYQFHAYGALPTPESTIPSNTGDLGRSNTTYCNDFLGTNGPKLQLEYDIDYQRPVFFELVRSIDVLGFRAHKTNESGQSSAVSALPEKLELLSYEEHPSHRESQLRHPISRTQCRTLPLERPLDSITPQDLRRVLNVYEHQTGNNSCLVSLYTIHPPSRTKRASMPLSGVYSKTIWLFYDRTGYPTRASPPSGPPSSPKNAGSWPRKARTPRRLARPCAPSARRRRSPAGSSRYLAPPFYPTPPRGSTPVGGHPRPHSPNAVRHRRNMSRAGPPRPGRAHPGAAPAQQPAGVGRAWRRQRVPELPTTAFSTSSELA